MLRYLWTLTALGAAAVVFTFAGGGADGAGRQLDQAQRLLKEKKFTEAHAITSDLLEKAPEDLDVLAMHLRVLHELKNYRAVEHYANEGVERALKLGEEGAVAELLQTYSFSFGAAMLVDRSKATLANKMQAYRLGKTVVEKYPDNPRIVRAYVRILADFRGWKGERWTEIRRVAPRGIRAAYRQQQWKTTAELAEVYGNAVIGKARGIQPKPNEYDAIRRENPLALFDLGLDAAKKLSIRDRGSHFVGHLVGLKIQYLGGPIGGPDLDAAIKTFRDHEDWFVNRFRQGKGPVDAKEREAILDRNRKNWRLMRPGSQLAELLLDSPRRNLGLELANRYDTLKRAYLGAAKRMLASEKGGWRSLALAKFRRYGENPPGGLTDEDEAAIAKRDFEFYGSVLRGHEKKIDKLGTDRAKLLEAHEHMRDAADYYVTAAIKLGKTELAFETTERLQARALRDLLGTPETEPTRRESTPKPAPNRKFGPGAAPAAEAGRKLGVTQRDLVVDGALGGGTDGVRRPEEGEMVSESLASATLKEIQNCLDDGTTLLFTHVSGIAGIPEGWGFVAVISKDEFFLRPEKELLSHWGTVRRRCAEFRSLLESAPRKAWTDAERKRFEDISRRLYRHIVAPVEGRLKTKRLVIVPSSYLFQIPLGLLQDESGRYLCERFAVSYAPSATVLSLCLERHEDLGGRVRVFANPALAMPGSSLQFAEAEATAIRSVYPQADLYMGQLATESSLRSLLEESDILHLACHGFVDTKDAVRSYLALRPDGTHDGRFSALETQQSRTSAQLVVLSACETGRGAVYSAGEELVGMVRSWLVARAASVMVSLWKIDDKATSELMAEFYRNLKTMGRAEALQRAQIEMMKKYDNPYYWGAFVLYGDYR